MKGRILLKKYINEGLTDAERHQLEKLALDDDFLADAWEGLHNADQQIHKAALARLEASIQKSAPALTGRIVNMRRYIPAAIAASVVLLAAAMIFLKPNDDVLTTSDDAVALSPIPELEEQAQEDDVVSTQTTKEIVTQTATQKKERTIVEEGVRSDLANTAANDPISSAEPIKETTIALQTKQPDNAGTIPRKDGTKTQEELTDLSEESNPIAFDQQTKESFRTNQAKAIGGESGNQSSVFKKIKGEKLNVDGFAQHKENGVVMADQSEPMAIALDEPLGEAKEALFNKEYLKARNLAYKYLQANPKSGEGMALLGDIYIAGIATCGDSWMQSLTVLAALNKWQAAQQMFISAETAKHVKDQIAANKSKMPVKDEGFMRGVKKGDRAAVNCWVAEEVVVRFRE